MIRKFAAPKGKILFQPGQPCPGYVVLSQGSIRVTLTGASGREVVLYRVRPGEVCLQTFSCLVEGKEYGAEGVAESDLVGEIIPADHFLSRLAEDEGFRTDILRSVATRFADYQTLIEDVALSSFDARLARVLLRHLSSDGFVGLTHAALASETASGRAYVTRRLAALAERGVVEQRDHGLQILDKAGLEQIAAETR
ncbi:MAG: Crp/Fnr family transcriptional regulator [Pseudomonadota bacterium]